MAPFDKPTIFLFVPHKIISFQRQQLDGNGIFAKNKLIMLMDGYVRELYAGHELSHRKTSRRFFPPGTRRYRRTPLRELADPLPYKTITKKGERKKEIAQRENWSQ